jgi:hypothetical protein
MPFLSNWPLLKRLALAPFRRSLTLDMARKREKTENRDLLCPISIDDAWKSKLDDDASDRALWRTLMKKAIIDFSPAADFETSFGKLLRGLKINYPK